MGLSDLLKQLFGKPAPSPAPSETPGQEPVPPPAQAVDFNRVAAWRCSYLWGFTQGFPMSHSADGMAFARLISLATGRKGAVTIGASFHPYQLVNPKGVHVWAQTLVSIIVQKACDLKVIGTTHSYFHMNPPGPQAFPLLVWPDTRLMPDVTPAFGTYVPFIIPYLEYEDGLPSYWTERLEHEVLHNGHAHAYLESINAALRFLLADPAFVVGFGTLDEKHPEALLDNFVRFIEQHPPSVG